LLSFFVHPKNQVKSLKVIFIFSRFLFQIAGNLNEYDEEKYADDGDDAGNFISIDSN